MSKFLLSSRFFPNMLLEFLFFIFCKFFFRFFCSLRIHGQANLPKPPFIICSNHCSHIDTPVLMLATNLYFKKLAIIVAEDYFFSNKKGRGIIRLFMNIIPINRQGTHRSLRNALQQSKQFFDQGGHCLIIYPEGTRSGNGEMQPFKRGIKFLANELNLPIVPVYIHGTYKVLSRSNSIPKPGRITVHIGRAQHVVKKLSQPEELCVVRKLENQIQELKRQR